MILIVEGGAILKKFNVLTCADAKFHHFLPNFERNVFSHFAEYPIIYDLGFSDIQRSILKSDIVSANGDFDITEKADSENIRATHKPSCIIDFLDRYKTGCLYVDADVIFTEAIDPLIFDDVDIAVTPRHPKEIQYLPDPYKNGEINSGVLFFANTAKSRDILAQWKMRCEQTRESDQMALSMVLHFAKLREPYGLHFQGDITILKLDPTIYNDVSCKTGKIWHFKNAGRRFHKKVKLLIASFITRRAPALMRIILRNNRSKMRVTHE